MDNEPAMPVKQARRLDGKRLVAGLFLLGALLAGFGWWWHYRETRGPLRLLGSQHALRIRDARPIEALRIERVGKDPAAAIESSRLEPLIEFGGQSFRVTQRQDASQVRGVNDVRRALVADFAYDWTDDGKSCAPQWQYALVLGEPPGQTRLLFAPNCRRIALTETGAQASIQPVSEFVHTFFRRALREESPR